MVVVVEVEVGTEEGGTDEVTDCTVVSKKGKVDAIPITGSGSRYLSKSSIINP